MDNKEKLKSGIDIIFVLAFISGFAMFPAFDFIKNKDMFGLNFVIISISLLVFVAFVYRVTNRIIDKDLTDNYTCNGINYYRSFIGNLFNKAFRKLRRQ